MVKMNFTNSQTAFEYALYMIAASYFNKSDYRENGTCKINQEALVLRVLAAKLLRVFF